MNRRLSLALLLGIVSLLITACSGQKPEPATLVIEMSEYAYSPETIEVKVGQEVTIELVNVGVLEHELMIGRTVMMMNNRPDGFIQDMFGMAHVEPTVVTDVMDAMGAGDHGAGHAGFMVYLPKQGDKATITFTVTRDMVGEWEMGCFEQEGVHYDAGMVGKFIVTP
jgi:plastocyanin